ncbi:uncharacterized protein [Littorina saxatilis]|uniref:uncharacterized protein n=1 Tax=Littorina saxatilis TaxID=31220 RepID=UPI0038B598AE
MSARQEPRVQYESRPDGREQHHDADAASVMHNNSFYASRSVCGEYADVKDQIKAVRPASRMYEGGRVYDEIQDSESDEEGATGGQDMYVDPFDVKKKKAAQGKNPGMRPMTRQ